MTLHSMFPSEDGARGVCVWEAGSVEDVRSYVDPVTPGPSRNEYFPVADAQAIVTALPAVDGTGDPQVSWLIEADGRRVLHLGDTMFHGWWWRIAERFGAPDAVLAPINGARVTFPHRRPASPLPAAMEPEQAALAADLLRAERLVPIHYGGYELPGVYEPVPDALERAQAASDRVIAPDLGALIEI